ncbi:MAG: ascorbate system or component [Actinomycetota bacterium]|jgi:PTS system ascorbate-specific IIA component|nr:ascorbate system or component [Actinomycetota bacterium]MDQ1561544.1 ascorbate system or component [Actinomycetota bacterium]MDQ1563978.1 ascorbate system or component [Actinomycetota bacterium]MDQ1574260.1 ascorbate system or component [Actinomycetota bacterium]
MSLPMLPADAVILGSEVANWRDAVRLAGTALSRAGIAKPEYAGEMIRMIEEHGPYVVIAPGLALAHARPGPEVLADGIAIVTLSTPVNFGHPYNDPVSVVLALAVASGDAHIALVAELANIFNDSSAVEELAAATSVDEVRRIMGAVQ